MKYILKKIWGIWFYVVLTSEFILLYPFFWVTVRRKKWHIYANGLRRFWAFTLFFFIGLRPRILYESGAKEFLRSGSRAVIYCPNHSSYADVPLVLICLSGLYRFMAKIELARIPLFGIFFYTIDVLVDRSSSASAYKAFEQAGVSLDGGVSVVLFPEGTTSNKAPEMLPFKNGAFKLAIDKQVPIVPMSILDNWHLFIADGKNMGRPGKTRIVVHNPIETAGMTAADIDDLKEKVYHVINTSIKTANETR